ncbi:hypothetical protein P5P86_07285 [Nocardioides sp. BP30]|nr:hypothetical protein [Nocardioides sp. BP30]WGL53627.1 hypothetical protein P5P86_07285 [Nocardioides sp. BP30]
MNQQLIEWGPARHDPDNPQCHDAIQAAIDRRDSDGPRPDDN